VTPTELTEHDAITLTDEVVKSFAMTPDPRLHTVLGALVRHLHAFVGEVAPTLAEWESAVNFLTAVGQKCDAVRQEFVLLSDVLGVSMLVESINDQSDQGGTEGTVLGPFHMTESPARQLGDTIDMLGSGPGIVVVGTVRDTNGRPLSHAAVDVWQCNENGFYDVQQPDTQPPGNGRGLFTADEAGQFRFRTVMPSHYPIPTDGPVGTLLNATRRHPYRPAHIHFIVETPDHRTLTTHIFIPDSPYLDSDAVFAVKQSLVGTVCQTSAAQAEALGVEVGTPLINVDLVLAPKTLQTNDVR
jgi:hydroxyquinol 1,2-dioxygenase